MSDPVSTINAAQLLSAQRETAAATLTACIVQAMGRPVSVDEVLSLQKDVKLSLYPDRGQGFYDNWAKTRKPALSKVQT